MPKKPTDLRGYRQRTERALLLGAVFLFVIVGGVLVGLIYDWRAAITALLCLIPGAGLLILLWLLVAGVDRITRE